MGATEWRTTYCEMTRKRDTEGVNQSSLMGIIYYLMLERKQQVSKCLSKEKLPFLTKIKFTREIFYLKDKVFFP